MAERAAGKRLYERLSQDLAAKIAVGQYAVGQRLPAERHLAKTYEVSRPTVREAIIALEVDGLVEVKVGSGVYVIACEPQGAPTEHDIGPFELLEARRAIEGEACALAASRISDECLDILEGLVAEMQAENARDIVMSEDADRRFHRLIAEATQNSALVAAVDMLWEARARSPQYQLLTSKTHAAGIKPRIDEHQVIVDALRGRDPSAARNAMQHHLSRVLESALQATEVREMELARARLQAQRERYAVS